MPTPLTAEHFDETMRAIAETLSDHGRGLGDIQGTLVGHTKRLERIEQLFWHGERLAEIEDRFQKLAERTGNADLATPLRRPLGT